MKPRIELISTGSELLSGRSLNTHARSLGSRLRTIGLELARDTTIGDSMDEITSMLRACLSDADIVFISGGLGPTEDDLTREALCEVLEKPLVEDEGVVAFLEAEYTQRGQDLSPSRRRQALVIEGAQALLNRVGAAPGQRIETDDGTILFVLPGPPPELEAVVDDHIMPWLRDRFPTLGKIDERLFLTVGLPESNIVEKLKAAGGLPPGVNIAYCASPQHVEVRLTGNSLEQLDAGDRFLSDLIGPWVYARERILLEEAIGRQLTERGLTLATAESCTGGLLGEKITAVSGSSSYYLGGIISYANEVKTAQLGVSQELLCEHGAVSPECAGAMAQGVRKRLGASVGVGITGIAGPSGGTEEKPVGLVYMGLADAEGVVVEHRVFHGDRALIRERAARFVLNMIRRRLDGDLPSSP